MAPPSKRRGALASQNRGQKSDNRGQSKAAKRRQGGKGKPFAKGQPTPGEKFTPGVSGNPGGRPRALKELRERIQRRGLDLVDMLFAIADGLPEHKGSAVVGPSHADRYHCMKELLDRGYGRTVQAVELTGAGGGPLEARDISDLNSAERRERLAELMAKAALKAAAATTAAREESDGGAGSV